MHLIARIAGTVLTLLAVAAAAFLAWQWRATGAPPAVGLTVAIVVTVLAAAVPHLPERRGPDGADSGLTHPVCAECRVPRRRGMDFCMRCGGTRMVSA